VGPNAVAGSSARRSPNVVPAGKCTSPPKASVTGFPLPSQSGLRGESAADGGLLAPCDFGWWTAGAFEWCFPPWTITSPIATAASRSAADQKRRVRLTRREVSSGRCQTAPSGHSGPLHCDAVRGSFEDEPERVSIEGWTSICVVVRSLCRSNSALWPSRHCVCRTDSELVNVHDRVEIGHNDDHE